MYLNSTRIINNLIEQAHIDKILSILHKYNSLDFYIAGGCIRDQLINNDKPIHDVDLFIYGNRLLIENCVTNLVSGGKVLLGPYNAPRLYFKDSVYWDIVPFDKFIVCDHKIRDINDLLMNFDFTANAIGLDLKTRTFIDPLNSISDIESKILRAIHFNFPDKSVSDTIKLSTISVLWFRLVHYQEYLNFKFDDKTLEWVIENKHRIKDLELFRKYFFDPMMSKELRQVI